LFSGFLNAFSNSLNFVFFSDIKGGAKGKTKLSELEKALRNPENKILNVVKNSQKGVCSEKYIKNKSLKRKA
jgi:hypothetical protein